MPAPPDNPAFPITRRQARDELARLRASPVRLARPVLILGGWRAPRLSAFALERLLAPLTSNAPDDFLTVTYPLARSLADAWRTAHRRLVRRFGPSGPGLATPIDVVGISMGGLVAKLAALSPDERSTLGGADLPQLRVARLFTLATPHRGARLAPFFPFDAATRLMRPGSLDLARLDRSPAVENLVPYALLRDWWVGATRTAPQGRVPIWLPPRTLPEKALAHFLITRNPWILADLARRLRGEPPLALPGPPPPTD